MSVICFQQQIYLTILLKVDDDAKVDGLEEAVKESFPSVFAAPLGIRDSLIDRVQITQISSTSLSASFRILDITSEKGGEDEFVDVILKRINQAAVNKQLNFDIGKIHLHAATNTLHVVDGPGEVHLVTTTTRSQPQTVQAAQSSTGKNKKIVVSLALMIGVLAAVLIAGLVYVVRMRRRSQQYSRLDGITDLFSFPHSVTCIVLDVAQADSDDDDDDDMLDDSDDLPTSSTPSRPQVCASLQSCVVSSVS